MTLAVDAHDDAAPTVRLPAVGQRSSLAAYDKKPVEFWPTAYRFPRGHRIRVIVASGAHPRYARNPGTGQPLGEAETMLIQHQEIMHGPDHPSAISLSVVSA